MLSISCAASVLATVMDREGKVLSLGFEALESLARSCQASPLLAGGMPAATAALRDARSGGDGEGVSKAGKALSYFQKRILYLPRLVS